MGTHLRVLGESYPMNTKGLDGFQNFLRHCALDESSLESLEGLSKS